MCCTMIPHSFIPVVGWCVVSCSLVSSGLVSSAILKASILYPVSRYHWCITAHWSVVTELLRSPPARVSL